MTERKATILSILICLLAALPFAIILTSCVPASPQPEFHPIAGKSVMFIPKGCKIGDVPAPENGIYIGGSKLIEQMLRQREEEKRRKQSQT